MPSLYGHRPGNVREHRIVLASARLAPRLGGCKAQPHVVDWPPPFSSMSLGRSASRSSAITWARSSPEKGCRKLPANVSSQSPISPGSGVGRGKRSMAVTTKPFASNFCRYSCSSGKYQGMSVRGSTPWPGRMACSASRIQAMLPAPPSSPRNGRPAPAPATRRRSPRRVCASSAAPRC